LKIIESFDYDRNAEGMRPSIRPKLSVNNKSPRMRAGLLKIIETFTMIETQPIWGPIFDQRC